MSGERPETCSVVGGTAHRGVVQGGVSIGAQPTVQRAIPTYMSLDDLTSRRRFRALPCIVSGIFGRHSRSVGRNCVSAVGQDVLYSEYVVLWILCALNKCSIGRERVTKTRTRMAKWRSA